MAMNAQAYLLGYFIDAIHFHNISYIICPNKYFESSRSSKHPSHNPYDTITVA